MTIDPNARYSKTQEWVRKEGNLMVYGITHHAQESLSDIVFIELPDVGASFNQGEAIGTIESVKAASDLILPMSGKVVEVNGKLSAAPETINASPYQDGWMIKFQATQPAEWDGLMSPEAYQQSLGE
ncbi:MAG: glycine cleavage system protein GcvH [Anaerolineae bacterium]|nr:glycine cleavage system protein GcvH [Anaerolineae bacterium]